MFIILSVGQSIEWGNLLENTNVVLNRNNTAKADSFTYQTGTEDIFVGGDCYSGPRFAIDAIAAGKAGADSLHRKSNNHDLLNGRYKRDLKEIDKENIIIDSYDRPARQKVSIDSSKKLTFLDERKTFTPEQIKEETKRCLECGVAVVDQTRCLGCGLCTTRCKNDAITLSKVSSYYGTTYEKLPARLAPAIVKRAGKIAITKVKETVSGD